MIETHNRPSSERNLSRIVVYTISYTSKNIPASANQAQIDIYRPIPSSVPVSKTQKNSLNISKEKRIKIHTKSPAVMLLLHFGSAALEATNSAAFANCSDLNFLIYLNRRININSILSLVIISIP